AATSSKRASTASGSERRNSRSTGLAQARSVSRARLAGCAPASGLGGAGRRRNVMDGLAAARRAVASAEVASLSGGSITATTTTARPRRRRCLAISTMGLRWPTPQRREQHKRLCPHGYRLPGPAAPIDQKGCEKPKQMLINIVRAWLNGTPSVPT
ncbi:Os03g0814550, partial [Oryza sativa Japonica Group]